MNGNMIRAAGQAAGVAVLCVFAFGCGGGSQNADQALNKAITATGGEKSGVAKFAGTVQIDGNPPESKGVVRTLVFLWDLKKGESGKYQPSFAWCDENGHFEFTTYEKGDGVPVGSYVVCFAQLEGGIKISGDGGWHGPDGFHNLYNDPDKNKDNKDFVVDISPPGKTDWDFRLEVQGKEPISTAGPRAITRMQ
jgi:hypothetical protein